MIFLNYIFDKKVKKMRTVAVTTTVLEIRTPRDSSINFNHINY